MKRDAKINEHLFTSKTFTVYKTGVSLKNIIIKEC